MQKLRMSKYHPNRPSPQAIVVHEKGDKRPAQGARIGRHAFSPLRREKPLTSGLRLRYTDATPCRRTATRGEHDRMAKLRIIGPEGQEERSLLPHNTLGRHPSNTMQLLDRIVSKEHCHIDWVDGRYVLSDLGSLNGTYVNGQRVKKHPLSNGDEVSLGATRLVYMADSGSFSPVDGTHTDSPSQVRELTSSFAIVPEGVESQIRARLAPLSPPTFLPERSVQDQAILRADYEKLRVSYEVIRTIGVELDSDKLLHKVLDCAFQLLPADRGVILLYDDQHELAPRCIRSRRPADDEAILLSRTILNEVLREKAAVMSHDVSLDARFQAAQSIILQGIRSTMAVPLLHSGEVFGIMMIDSHIATHAFTEKDLQLFQNVANQAAIAIQNSLYAKKLEREAVTRERFQRLLSPAIAEQVIEGRVEIAKGGELRETTVLFTDIRGFTAMSEFRRAQDIVDMLNDYFERMVELIFKYEGTLDKFVGDEIMALFGSPVSHPDDPYRAVQTALEMQRSLQEFNDERQARGHEPVRIGIGINSGEVVAGYLGSSRALEYTVIGDTVNSGSRLCALAKPGEILISDATYQRVRNHFEVQPLPPVQVKGKSQIMKIYKVIGARREQSSLETPAVP